MKDMNTKIKVLLVEDDAGLRMTVCDRLQAEYYECTAVDDGNAGFEAARSRLYDLILLDVMLPGKNGFDVCRDLRNAGIQTPVLMLTARDQIIDRVLGLKLGADDYLCKPFDMAELLARMEALLRREKRTAKADTGQAAESGAERSSQSEAVHDYTDFRFDFSRGIIEHQGKEQLLSAQEYKLMSYLCTHPEEIISRDALLDAAWGYESETSTRTVDVHIAWLRKKIGDTGLIPKHIQTVRGLGYRFIP